MLVSEVVELLLKSPQNNILVADIGEAETADVTDVLLGNGTTRGFSYLKIEPYRSEGPTSVWKQHVAERFGKVNC
jgi:hypothetical protein